MKYMILDEETQTHNKFKRKGNPFLPENYIVEQAITEWRADHAWLAGLPDKIEGENLQ